MKSLLSASVILVFFLLVNSCKDIFGNDVEDSLSRTIKVYCEGLKNFDSDLILNYCHPNIVNTMGGSDKYNEKMKESQRFFYENGISYKELKQDGSIKYSQHKNAIHAIVPIKTVVYTPKNKIVRKSHLYCFSENYGEKWVIAEYETTMQNYPEIKFPLSPDKEAETTEFSCNFFMTDVFANKVCIDRYLDSGEYKIEEFDGTFVSRLVKKEKPIVENGSNSMKSVEKALNDWIGVVGLKYQFPFPNEENVLYMKSDINQFYIYDIYGIPFTYYSEGKLQKDTLPGCFEVEYSKFFYSQNKTNTVDTFNNDFKILYEESDF